MCKGLGPIPSPEIKSQRKSTYFPDFPHVFVCTVWFCLSPPALVEFPSETRKVRLLPLFGFLKQTSEVLLDNQIMPLPFAPATSLLGSSLDRHTRALVLVHWSEAWLRRNEWLFKTEAQGPGQWCFTEPGVQMVTSQSWRPYVWVPYLFFLSISPPLTPPFLSVSPSITELSYKLNFSLV